MSQVTMSQATSRDVPEAETPLTRGLRRLEGVTIMPAADDRRASGPAAKPAVRTWRSCCLEIDSKAALFFSQLGISAVVIVFCVAQLVRMNDCESQRNYGTTLMFVVGLWLPSPYSK